MKPEESIQNQNSTGILGVKTYHNDVFSLAKFPAENPNPVMRLSFDGTLLFANNACEPFMNQWKTAPGKKIPGHINLMISAVSSGSHRDIEIECCSRVFSFTVVSIPGEGYFNLYGHDITLQKCAEERLRFQAGIIQNISDVIYTTDLKLRITNWNAAAEKLYGWKEKDVIGKSVIKATGFKLYPGNRKNLTLGWLKKEIVRSQIEHRTKSGSILFLDSITMVQKNADGQVIGFIVANRDITDKVLAEKALKESEEKYRTMAVIVQRAKDELMEARQKLNIALENAGIGLWEWDLKSGEMSWDEKLEKMFGLKPGAFERSYAAFENLVDEEDFPHVQRSLKNTIEKKQPFETIFRTKKVNGKSNHISSKAFVIYNKERKPVKLSGVCFDITGMQRETENLVLSLNEELLRSNKDLESFAYAASHDLQEPLRMVTTFTQLLERNYKDKLDAKGMEYIQFASDGAKRMYDLLNGLLAYSRINMRANAFGEVNMNQVVDAVKKNLSVTIKDKKSIVRSWKLPVVMADGNQMIQLVQNLVANSLKFNTGAPKIYISCRSDKNKFTFSVKDNGIGIDPQYKDRIFQIFQRLQLRKNYDGNGIGLAICNRIIERHGGKIWVKSAGAQGSTFFFTIPRYPAYEKSHAAGAFTTTAGGGT